MKPFPCSNYDTKEENLALTCTSLSSSSYRTFLFDFHSQATATIDLASEVPSHLSKLSQVISAPLAILRSLPITRMISAGLDPVFNASLVPRQ